MSYEGRLMAPRRAPGRHRRERPVRPWLALILALLVAVAVLAAGAVAAAGLGL